MSPVETVVALLDQREPACGFCRVVGVDGPSGSGKTTFAGRLSDATDARVLHLENLYEGWHGLESAVPKAAQILAAVAVDEVGRAPGWDWEHDRPGPDVTLTPAPVIVVEGVGAAAAAIRPFLSVVVWVDGPEGERRRRALMRDGDTYAPWWDVWAAQERRHFAREATRGHADVVLDA